jgi:hypothetical protein
MVYTSERSMAKREPNQSNIIATRYRRQEDLLEIVHLHHTSCPYRCHTYLKAAYGASDELRPSRKEVT